MHTNLDIHIPIFMINISISVSDDSILFAPAPMRFSFFYSTTRGNFEAEKNESTAA